MILDWTQHCPEGQWCFSHGATWSTQCYRWCWWRDCCRKGDRTPSCWIEASQGVKCIPEPLQNDEITNSNLLRFHYPIVSPASLFIIWIIFFQEVQLLRILRLRHFAAKCRDHRSKIRTSTCATLAAIARGGGKELLGSLGMSAEAQSEVLTSVPWLPDVSSFWCNISSAFECGTCGDMLVFVVLLLM